MVKNIRKKITVHKKNNVDIPKKKKLCYFFYKWQWIKDRQTKTFRKVTFPTLKTINLRALRYTVLQNYDNI